MNKRGKDAFQKAVILVSVLALFAFQAAEAGRLFGAARDAQERRRNSELAKLRRYISGLTNDELGRIMDPSADGSVLDHHITALGKYEARDEDRKQLQAEAKDYWDHFRHNAAHEHTAEAAHTQQPAQKKYNDEFEWMIDFQDYPDEAEDNTAEEVTDGNAEQQEADDTKEEGQGREQSGTAAGDGQAGAEEREADEQTEGVPPEANGAGAGVDETAEEVTRGPAKMNLSTDAAEGAENAEGEDSRPDWVLSLAGALQSSNETAMEAAILTAIGAGEVPALEELIQESANIAGGDRLQAVWNRVREEQGIALPTSIAPTPNAAELEKTGQEAEAMEEEAEEYLGEAENLNKSASKLEREFQSINASYGEFNLMEAADELGETAEALDSESAKLQLESSKLMGEAMKLEQQAAEMQGQDEEADRLLQEASKLKAEAERLRQEAQVLRSKANSLDGEADRIDRIEKEQYIRDEEERQARIEQDLRAQDFGGAGADAPQQQQDNSPSGPQVEEQDHRPQRPYKASVSHSALLSRFKTLLRAR
eukprot:CAMPEP_0177601358 /NCGR_PEP_ID=MMETSP0419_2-20121207/14208_1 /TAXON_ID=582737 /ORGANISM="Tetraselmis sp., Strain GSL018" /LENGTH=538 /DNA_ID=CAMNT_0019094601 /DNA_START=675 /DNA_END=2291 /DNA_ORIENTATION=-